MDDEPNVVTIDLRDTFHDYSQFSSFGTPSNDENGSATAQTIKPLIDAMHESMELIVSSIGSINSIVSQLSAFIPQPMSVNSIDDTQPSELAKLNDSVQRLNAVFATINPSKEEE